MNNQNAGTDEQSVPVLHISQLRPHLGELNYILKDYGVCVVVMCDEKTGNVTMDDGKAHVTIGEPRLWFESVK